VNIKPWKIVRKRRQAGSTTKEKIMKDLFWNVRGLGGKNRRGKLKEIINKIEWTSSIYPRNNEEWVY
jgi:hypothetical protein